MANDALGHGADFKIDTSRALVVNDDNAHRLPDLVSILTDISESPHNRITAGRARSCRGDGQGKYESLD